MTAPSRAYLTSKQQAIMAVLLKRNLDNSPVDLDQVLERLPYETSKESLQFSIRALVNRNLVRRLKTELRRGRSRRPVELTREGLEWMAAGVKAAGGSPTFVTGEEEAALEELEAEVTAVWD